MTALEGDGVDLPDIALVAERIDVKISLCGCGLEFDKASKS